MKWEKYGRHKVTFVIRMDDAWHCYLIKIPVKIIVSMKLEIWLYRMEV